MPTIQYRLNRKQRKAFDLLHACERTGKPKYIGYGGARGGGKSYLGRVVCDYMCSKYPGITGLVLRRTMPELRQNYIEPLIGMLQGRASFNESKGTFKFKNGSRLICGYCDNRNHVRRYQGNEYQFIVFEECTMFDQEWIELIIPSCRGANDYPKFILITTNPGGPGHAWFKKHFIDRQFKTTEDPEDYAFVQALATDNTVLMEKQPDYVQFLDSLSPKYRKMWRDGSWDVYEGAFFEEFTNDPEHYDDGIGTHVIKAFMPSKRWTYYRSMDWGYRRPFAVGYYAVAPDEEGTIYRIAELYGVQYENGEALANEGVKKPPDEVFAMMKRFEREHPYLKGRRIYGVADPAMWNAERGESIAETAERYGIYFDKGDHARIAGWMQCHYRMQFGDEGRPRFYVFDTCKEFIRTIPTLQCDEHNVEDLDTSMEDHIADEWRYLLMTRPVKPIIVPEKYRPAYGSDPLNQFEEED